MISQSELIALVRNDELHKAFSSEEIAAIEGFARNIKATYAVATSEQLAAGHNWYARARNFAVDLARE